MLRLIRNYINWLHTRWPAGHVERLPEVDADGSTSVPGLYVVGDITGIPLLKFSSHTGAKTVRTILEDASFKARKTDDESVHDLIVIGAGVSGVSAMAEATKAGLRCEILEATQALSTVVNFPKGKPIFTYPTEMIPDGDMQFGAGTEIKEGLVAYLRSFMAERNIVPRIARVEKVRRKGGLLEIDLAGGETLKAHRVIVGIGRSGNFRKLGVAGEDLAKVSNRLHDPKDYRKKHVLIVGGGDSAMETSIAIAECGGFVTLSYRKSEFSRAKPENVEAMRKLAADPYADVTVEEPVSERVTTAVGKYMQRYRRAGSIRVMMSSDIKEINEDEVIITNEKNEDETLPNDFVFSMIGREAPLDFFRKCGVHIRGEWRALSYLSFFLFFAFCLFLYHWKSDAGFGLKTFFKEHDLFPFNLDDVANPANLIGTIRISMLNPSFYYTLAYTSCIVIFGIKRIRRRKTPYIKAQTITLMSIQAFPLFILPFVLLPWMGHNGWFESGVGKSIADALFPLTQWDDHGREYWRSVGFILAWPLLPWNFFTGQPMMAWLIIGCIQTFVLIPLMVWKWGKGAYCGWICSCGALAETMGDTHRHKMPHGPLWNRLNMIGQVFLIMVAALFVFRIVGWVAPVGSWLDNTAEAFFRIGFYGKGPDGSRFGFPGNLLNYEWFVDLLWAGVFGVAFYFWFSGRVWCRFACPLAALMHIYARFSKFRIIPEKKKCISCNVCTSVCHQGIDVMNFANKGIPMEDPECVRCSACVQSCPTGVLQFGEVNRKTGETIRLDRLGASPVLMAELTVEGRTPSI